MSAKADILIVEDDEAIATGLALNLRLEGYGPKVVHDGEEALSALTEAPPDLILLDISLPVKSGLDFLAEIRDAGDSTPVIVLSARQSEYDKVAALRLGADDYVTKPFALAELIARVDAVLRRAGGDAPGVGAPDGGEPRAFGDVIVHLATRVVTRRGKEVRLTHREFELLSFFLRHPGRVFSRLELLKSVWGLKRGSQRTVDNFVAQLRSKLERDADKPRLFITVRGSGYRFDPQ